MQSGRIRQNMAGSTGANRHRIHKSIGVYRGIGGDGVTTLPPRQPQPHPQARLIAAAAQPITSARTIADPISFAST
jgi:hypothetical protein